MLDACLDEDRLAFAKGDRLPHHLEDAAAFERNVDLVVLVWLLAVGLGSDEDVDADLEPRRLVDDLVTAVRRHEPSPRLLDPEAVHGSTLTNPVRRTIPAVADESAEVVVVGGGAMGASVAFHLAELGITDVVLVERETLASGSTSRSAGGIRTQFADELNIRIALRSLAEFVSFPERVGASIDLDQSGYLFLLDDERDVERFRAALALQASLGVPSRELSPADVSAIVPSLVTDDLLAGTFCPLDGRATPEAVVAGYAERARTRGVRVRQREPVERIEIRGGRIESIVTSKARIATRTIVCTAGVWARDVGALAGVEIPVEGERRWIHYTPDADGLPTPLPLTIDFTTSFYFHREGPGLAFGGREQTIEELAVAATKRLPVLSELPIASSWSGFYEMSPDRNAIVGETAEPSRFLYATGFSGHGFQQAPAVGEHLAELVAGRRPTLDLTPFSLERFARGAVREEQFVV